MIMKFIRKEKARSNLIKAFQASETCKKKTKNGRTIYIYPKIVSIRFSDDKTEYVFILPPGILPESVQEKLTVFKQVIGRNLELSHDNVKKCVLSLYFKTIPDNYNYNFEKISPCVAKMKLPLICGLDINAEFVAIDLAKEAHALLSGETGSGKSSLLRAVLTTLIQIKEPEELRIHLGDLKRSEMGLFRNKKLIEGVYTTPNELGPALKKIRKEMQRRGDMLDRQEVNDITELSEKLPRILFVIDEVALLQKEKDIMGIIEEISSIGRALGVHLLLSMQRPDSKILESGALKNNLRVRISGRQSNASNAKVAGVPGVETIGMKQHGRMKIKLDNITEFQAPYIDSAKVKKILRDFRVEKPVGIGGLVEGEGIEERKEEREEENILGVLE